MGQIVRVAIMQPYFLPYIGYWQLMHHVDIFVVYDDIEYTKKGWINRNRYILNGKPEIFSLPIRSGSDFLDVRDRYLSDAFGVERVRLMRRLEAAYRRAPFFLEGRSILADVLADEEKNLFKFIFKSIEYVHILLGMSSRLVISSGLGISRRLRSQERVIATCKAVGATDYINPIGGLGLYSEQAFCAEGIRLHFQQARHFTYRQYENTFVPNLSIIDSIMFLGLHAVKQLLSEMDVVDPIRK